MKVRSLDADSVDTLKEAIANSMSDGFSPTLAIVFASVSHDLSAVAGVFGDTGMDVFGASSSGEIHVNTNAECVFEQSVVALMFDLDRAHYRLHLLDAGDQSSLETGAAIGSWAKSTFADPGLLILASGLRTDGEQLVKGILEEVGATVPIFGGLAGDDVRFQETVVFGGAELHGHAVYALSLDMSRVAFDGVAVSGWQAVGAEKTITSSEGNVVHTIDGIPALDLYKDYLGVASDTDIIIPEYPLQIVKEGYSVLRAALLTDPLTRSLIYAGTVPQGAKVRFSAAPGVEISAEALAEMHKLRMRTEGAEMLLLFSCKGRHMALGPMAEDEIKPMQDLWKVPMVGFFTYGEIGINATGQCDLHNENCVLVTLREK